MNKDGNYPEVQLGRRSGGMLEEDWHHLAMAYDVWNDHLAVADEIDPDLRAFVRDVFLEYRLWNFGTSTPNLEGYRKLILNRC